MQMKNAKIESVSLTMADHDILTFWLHLRLDGCCCGCGGFMVGKGCLGAKEFKGFNHGLEAMMRIMDVVGVCKWEDLPGKYIRYIDNGHGSSIDTIGNIIEEKWFNIRDFFTRESDKRD